MWYAPLHSCLVQCNIDVCDHYLPDIVSEAQINNVNLFIVPRQLILMACRPRLSMGAQFAAATPMFSNNLQYSMCQLSPCSDFCGVPCARLLNCFRPYQAGGLFVKRTVPHCSARPAVGHVML